MKKLFTSINYFYKLAQALAPTETSGSISGQPSPTQPNQLFAQPIEKKPGLVYRDRFKGATGQEREELIKAEARKKGFILVPHKMTPLDKTQVLLSLKNIIKKEMSTLNDLQIETIAKIMTSQIYTETGGKSCHNYNVGNYHSLSNNKNKYWDGKSAIWNDPQIDKGGNKYINMDTFWRAYDNLENGIGDYFLLIKKRFPKALEFATNGDLVGFATDLGTKGYYSKHVINDYIKNMKGFLKKL